MPCWAGRADLPGRGVGALVAGAIPPDEILRDYFLVRGGGLEPPWLLTASTSKGIDAARANDFAALERQETSEFGQKRPILAELGQNSIHRVTTLRAGVTSAICEVLERWASGCPVREARVQLARLLAMLEAVED